MLSCKQLTENANDYIEQNLPLKSRISVKLHLLMCIHCRRYVHQLKTTVTALTGLKSDWIDTADQETTDKLLEIYKQHKVG